jgi:hypothetical protein
VWVDAHGKSFRVRVRLQRTGEVIEVVGSRKSGQTAFDRAMRSLHANLTGAADRITGLSIWLSSLKASAWPSIPELAMVRLRQLVDVGLDSYDEQTVGRVKKLRALEKQLGTGPTEFEPFYERYNESGDYESMGVYPIPRDLTGERLYLEMGDPNAATRGERVPRVVRDPHNTMNVAILSAVTVLEAGLDREGELDERPNGRSEVRCGYS